MIPFFEVLLHTYIDNLRQEDDEREINHHGEKRHVAKGIMDDSEEDNTNGSRIIAFEKTNNILPFDENLISRQEVTQDEALKKFYALSIITNETKLRVATMASHTIIPIVVTLFIIGYWCAGLIHVTNVS